MNFRPLFIATFLVLGMAQAAQPSPETVDEIVAEANRRSKAGQSAEEVESWMAEAMQRAGVSVKRKPPSWDVYGVARWAQENPDENGAGNEADTISGSPAVATANERQPQPTVEGAAPARPRGGDVRTQASHGGGHGF